jgi:hypothetical protein
VNRATACVLYAPKNQYVPAIVNASCTAASHASAYNIPDVGSSASRYGIGENVVSIQCRLTMLKPISCWSLQNGIEPYFWSATISVRRVLKMLFRRSESPMNVQPAKRLRRKR